MVAVSSGAGSRQDYKTPDNFMRAVKQKFGTPGWDLAASSHNWQCHYYYDEIKNSLVQDWASLETLLWLNPPFNDIAPWAAKCASEVRRGAEILFLVPASVGSEWFAEHVYQKANVYLLRGRLSFDGKSPYPKDCLLAHYTPRHEVEFRISVWDWRKWSDLPMERLERAIANSDS